MLRVVRQRLGGAAGDPEALLRRVEAGWCQVARRTKLCWERAAEVLVETARVGRRVFTSAMEQDISCTLPCPGDQWPGPLDFLQADELHGVDLDLAGLQAGQEKVEPALREDAGNDDMRTSADKETQTEHSPYESLEPSIDATHNVVLHSDKQEVKQSSDDSPCVGAPGAGSLPAPPAPAPEHSGSGGAARSPGTPVKRPAYLATRRNKRGRWEAAAREEVATFHCSPCSFTTATEWKLRRHQASSKHLARLTSVSSGASGGSSGPGLHPAPAPAPAPITASGSDSVSRCRLWMIDGVYRWGYRGCIGGVSGVYQGCIGGVSGVYRGCNGGVHV